MADINERVRAEIAGQAAEATVSDVGGRWVLAMTRALRHLAGLPMRTDDGGAAGA